jgi:hypothetical protein
MSPDITTSDFFLWGYVKDRVFIPPLPRWPHWAKGTDHCSSE